MRVTVGDEKCVILCWLKYDYFDVLWCSYTTESLMVNLIHLNQVCLFSVREWGKKPHVGRGCTKMPWKESLCTGKNGAKYPGQRYQQTSMNGLPQERNGVWIFYNYVEGNKVSDIFRNYVHNVVMDITDECFVVINYRIIGGCVCDCF